MENVMKNIKVYVISIAIPLLVGGLSALLTMGNMDLYDEIVMPPLAPPAILFPIVWTLLYVLMGISAARIFTARSVAVEKRRQALTTYAISLALNFFWSIIFFNLGAFFIALLWLVALLWTIVKTIFQYKEIDLAAALLQIPYAIWVSFAGYLTAAIWWLN